MSPRKRNPENAGLPTGWRWKGARLYYMVPKGYEADWDGKTEFPLGGSIAGAYKIWAERLAVQEQGALVSFTHLCDRYLEQHVGTLAPKTQESYRMDVGRIRAVFGSTHIADMSQQLAREFHNAVKLEKGISSARSTLTVLKAMMSKAAEWGAVPSNPMLGMRFESSGKRKRYLEDWEIKAMLSVPTNFRGAEVLIPYIKIKLLTGLRRGDLLRLKLSDLKEDGIHVQPHKTLNTTAKRMHFTWNDQLRTAVEQAQRVSPRRIGDSTLFVTRKGTPYIGEDGRANGFDSIWRRFVDKAVETTTITERFQEKDLRAKVGSDAESIGAAQEILGHSSPAVTERHYRRAATVIQTPTLDSLKP